MTSLLHQLYELYTAERNLAFALAGWCRQSTSMPVRLMLADLRRDGLRQCLRLERLMQSLTGAVASRVAANMMTTMRHESGRDSRDGTGAATTRSVLTMALQATRTTIGVYRSAITLADAAGAGTAAALLTETLGEKRHAAAALTRLRRDQHGVPAAPRRSPVGSRDATHDAVAVGER